RHGRDAVGGAVDRGVDGEAVDRGQGVEVAPRDAVEPGRQWLGPAEPAAQVEQGTLAVAGDDAVVGPGSHQVVDPDGGVDPAGDGPQAGGPEPAGEPIGLGAGGRQVAQPHQVGGEGDDPVDGVGLEPIVEHLGGDAVPAQQG